MTPLSGSLPGLLRRVSPVFWRDEETPYVVTRVNGGSITAAPCRGLCLGTEDDASNFTLDTSDPTGAFHARLWAGTDPERLRVIREAGVDAPTGLPDITREGLRSILAEQAQTRALLEHPEDLSPLSELHIRADYAGRWQALGVFVEDLLNEVERLEARL